MCCITINCWKGRTFFAVESKLQIQCCQSWGEMSSFCCPQMTLSIGVRWAFYNEKAPLSSCGTVGAGSDWPHFSKSVSFTFFVSSFPFPARHATQRRSLTVPFSKLSDRNPI